MTSPLAKSPNPFHGVIVSDPWQFLETDVRTIHQEAFACCCRAIDEVRSKHHSAAVLIHGEAGSGKTHLLARLRAHLAVEAKKDGPGGLQEAIFVPLRMQTGAHSLRRFLRRQFAAALLYRQSNGQLQLERLLFHRLATFLQIPVDDQLWLERQRQRPQGTEGLQQQLSDLFDQINADELNNLNLRTVLTHLLLHRHRSEANAWFRGDNLSQEAYARLGIGDDQEEDAEDLAYRVVKGLCSLATADLPIVFCFDQVEAIQTHPQDITGLFAFGQMVAALHDETKHSLLISCIQSAFRNQLESAVRIADWHRMTEMGRGLVSLNPLTWEEAKQLTKARLDAVLEINQLRNGQSDSLWPLSEAAVKSELTQTGISARKLLARCAELFDAVRIGTPNVVPIHPSNQLFLRQAWETRKEQTLASGTPDQTNEILKDGLQRLLPLARRDWKQLVENKPHDLDLLFTDQNQRIGIGLCTSKHWPSLVKKLERLEQLPPQEKPEKLLLMRDQRLPLGTNAIKTKRLREKLLRGGALWIEPSPECLATLETLRGLLADAQSGDLANGGETINVETLRDWLLSNLSTEFKVVLEEILPSVTPEPDDLRERLTELLQRYHVARLSDAADLLRLESAALGECALKYPERFGALGNPPVVLFELANAVALA